MPRAPLSLPSSEALAQLKGVKRLPVERGRVLACREVTSWEYHFAILLFNSANALPSTSRVIWLSAPVPRR